MCIHEWHTWFRSATHRREAVSVWGTACRQHMPAACRRPCRYRSEWQCWAGAGDCMHLHLWPCMGPLYVEVAFGLHINLLKHPWCRIFHNKFNKTNLILLYMLIYFSINLINIREVWPGTNSRWTNKSLVIYYIRICPNLPKFRK